MFCYLAQLFTLLFMKDKVMIGSFPIIFLQGEKDVFLKVIHFDFTVRCQIMN